MIPRVVFSGKLSSVIISKIQHLSTNPRILMPLMQPLFRIVWKCWLKSDFLFFPLSSSILLPPCATNFVYYSPGTPLTATALQWPLFFVPANKNSIHWLLFKASLQRPPHYNSHFLLSPRWPLWRGSTVTRVETLAMQATFQKRNHNNLL